MYIWAGGFGWRALVWRGLCQAGDWAAGCGRRTSPFRQGLAEVWADGRALKLGGMSPLLRTLCQNYGLRAELTGLYLADAEGADLRAEADLFHRLGIYQPDFSQTGSVFLVVCYLKIG